MVLSRRFLIFAGAVIAASTAYGSISTDKLIIKGNSARPGIETNAPIPIRHFLEQLNGSYTVNPLKGDYSGKVFLVGGTSARQINLPQPSPKLAGYRYTFINDVDHNLVIYCSDSKLYFADSAGSWIGSYLRIETLDKKKGVVISLICNGSYWYLESISPNFPFTRS